MRVAAIDCGTNSARLLVADLDADKTLVEIVRRVEIVRLGQGVDAVGALTVEALARASAVLAVYGQELRRLAVDAVRVIATSAIRDAVNAADFRQIVMETIGAAPEVISGEEEARLSFVGAVRDLSNHPAPWCVVDVGGGSTELVIGSAPAAISAAASVDIGAVRITERCFASDPPTPAQLADARATVRDGLTAVLEQVPATEAHTFVGVAGSVTTVAAIALDLATYDRSAIHHARLAARDVQRIAEMLASAPHAQRAAIGAIHPGRVDVIAAGALIVHEVMAAVGAPSLIVSEHDILDGVAYSLVERAE